MRNSPSTENGISANFQAELHNLTHPAAKDDVMDRRISQFSIAQSLWIALGIIACLYSHAYADETTEESAKKYLLRHKFQNGQVARFDVTDKQTIDSQFSGAKETVNSETRAQRSYRVISIDDEGNAELELTIEKVWMKNQFNESDAVIFDSEDATKQPEQFANIMETVGKPMSQMKISPRGVIVKATRIGAKQEISAEETQNLNFLIVLPEEEIPVGGEWSEDLFVEVPVDRVLKKKIKLRRKYKLESVEKDIAKISLNTVILTPIRNPRVKGGVISLKPAGLLKFDIAKGQLLERSTKVRDRVIGAFGENSLMEMATDRTEKYVSEVQAAEIPTPTATK